MKNHHLGEDFCFWWVVDKKVLNRLRSSKSFSLRGRWATRSSEFLATRRTVLILDRVFHSQVRGKKKWRNEPQRFRRLTSFWRSVWDSPLPPPGRNRWNRGQKRQQWWTENAHRCSGGGHDPPQPEMPEAPSEPAFGAPAETMPRPDEPAKRQPKVKAKPRPAPPPNSGVAGAKRKNSRFLDFLVLVSSGSQSG